MGTAGNERFADIEAGVSPAPLVAPFAVASGGSTWIVAELIVRPRHVQACVAALVAALVCCGIGLAVARARHYRWLILCSLALAAGAVVALVTVVGVGRYGNEPILVLLASVAGAIAALPLLLLLLLIHAFERRARRARPGSVVERSDRARVWLVCLAPIALWALLAGLSGSIATPLQIVLLALSALGLVAIAARDFGVAARIRQALTNAELTADEPLHDAVPQLDLGLGAERWLCDIGLGPPYRSDGRPELVLVGDLEIVAPLLRRAARASCFIAIAATAALAGLAFRPVRFEKASLPQRSAAIEQQKPVEVPTGLSWYPQGPILVDLNRDGIEDVIGLRWNSNDESRALSVVANDGRTLRPLWRSEPLRSQWFSARTHLVRSGARLFLTDSEGLLHFYDIQTGRNTRDAVHIERSRSVCVVPKGPPLLFISDEKWSAKEYREGILVDAAGKISHGLRPDGCEDFAEWPAWQGPKQCANKLNPKLGRHSAFYQYELDDVGVGFGYGDGVQIFGFDPKSCTVRWEGPLAFTRDPLHENPQLLKDFTKAGIYGFYQLASGHWLLGARDPRTGNVLWQHELPRAEHGSNTGSLVASEQRLYVALDWRLEVFEPLTGESIGTLW